MCSKHQTRRRSNITSRAQCSYPRKHINKSCSCFETLTVLPWNDYPSQRNMKLNEYTSRSVQPNLFVRLICMSIQLQYSASAACFHDSGIYEHRQHKNNNKQNKINDNQQSFHPLEPKYTRRHLSRYISMWFQRLNLYTTPVHVLIIYI